MRKQAQFDTRVRNVVLTKNGQSTYDLVWPEAKKILARFTSVLTEQELRSLIGSLRKMEGVATD